MARQAKVRVLRAERLGENRVKEILDHGGGTLTDVRSSRWRLMPSGTLVVFFGGGRYFGSRFLGTATLVEESVRDLAEVEGVESTYLLESARWFEGGARLLSEFLFSFVQVTNFSRPWLHFRHRGAFLREDMETLQEGRIDAPRTILFGLLRGIPPEWRESLETRARYEIDAGITNESLAARTLSLVERVAVDSAIQARQLDDAFHHLGLGNVGITAVIPGTDEVWNVSQLLSACREFTNPSEAWQGLLSLGSTGASLERQWRPHRW